MRKQAMLTTREFAEKTGVPYPTIARWAQTGVIPGADLDETPRGPVWLIPQKALETFENWRPQVGRPKKRAKTSKKSRKNSK